jgi:hypothetical protein
VTETLDEQLAVRVQHDLDHRCIIERDAELIAERFLQLADQARVGTELVRIPRLSGRVFQLEAGHHSGMKPATIPE